MSMQDRIDMYNRDLEDQSREDAGNMDRPERVRKASVVFDQPQVTITGGVLNVVETASQNTEVEVHQVRPGHRSGQVRNNIISSVQAPPPTTNQPVSKTRKVSKVSMFDFVPEEN